MKRTPLKAKTPIKRQAKPKARKRLPLEKQTAQQLVKVADKLFSQYIRLRDSELQPDGSRMGQCISCLKQIPAMSSEGKWTRGWQNGHYVGRGNYELRFSELNCNGQCSHCNAWRDKLAMLRGYEAGLTAKYGVYVIAELQEAPVRYSAKKAELLEIIEQTRILIKYLTEADGSATVQSLT